MEIARPEKKKGIIIARKIIKRKTQSRNWSKLLTSSGTKIITCRLKTAESANRRARMEILLPIPLGELNP